MGRGSTGGGEHGAGGVGNRVQNGAVWGPEKGK